MTKAVATIALLAALVGLPAIHAQQVHDAPTVAQCRADQRLWMSKLESETCCDTVSLAVLTGWGREMYECKAVDPEFKIQYANTGREVIVEEASRYVNFLGRHHLYGQFVVEDAQGKR
jgi:hypothetical protein